MLGIPRSIISCHFKKHHSDIEESTSIHEIDIIDINLDLCKYSFQIIDN